MNYDLVKYFIANVNQEFYIDKLRRTYKILKNFFPHLKLKEVSMKYMFNTIGQKKDYINETNELIIDDKTLYILDEIIYSHLLSCYISCPQLRLKIINFLENSKYIVLYCETFKNDNIAEAHGNYQFDIDFSIAFFKNSIFSLLCYSYNIELLRKNNIINNVYYFPPNGYSRINSRTLEHNEDKSIDLLFFGSIFPEQYPYRHKMISQISNLRPDYNFRVHHNNLFYEEKEKVLKDTKIVLHIFLEENSYEFAHHFPWARINDLMCNKIFFIIPESKELYRQKLENTIIFYKNIDDLLIKIDYYLQHENERIKTINDCYDYISKTYNLDEFILNKFKK